MQKMNYCRDFFGKLAFIIYFLKLNLTVNFGALEEDWQSVFLDLLQAGTDTTSAFLETLMLYMVLYPDFQDGVWSKIQSVIIPNGEPSQDDIQRRPFTQVALLESIGMRKVSVNLVPRRILEHIHFLGISHTESIIQQLNNPYLANHGIEWHAKILHLGHHFDSKLDRSISFG
jgi:hypothetical protein